MSSKRQVRRKKCEGKVRYPDQGAARAVIQAIRGQGGGSWLNAYRCPFCHGWHIGHTPVRCRLAMFRAQEGD